MHLPRLLLPLIERTTMDPNEALKETRDALKRLIATLDVEPIQHSSLGLRICANNLAMAVEGLDEWLTRGGALPSDWKGERS